MIACSVIPHRGSTLHRMVNNGWLLYHWCTLHRVISVVLIEWPISEQRRLLSMHLVVLGFLGVHYSSWVSSEYSAQRYWWDDSWLEILTSTEEASDFIDVNFFKVSIDQLLFNSHLNLFLVYYPFILQSLRQIVYENIASACTKDQCCHVLVDIKGFYLFMRNTNIQLDHDFVFLLRCAIWDIN